MEALYIKLYEKYSKLKVAKDAEWENANKDQELKFVEFVSAAESLIEQLTAETKRLSKNVTDLQNEVQSVRTAKEQQIDELQELLKEEKKKNQQLSAEVEQLRHVPHERPCNSNRSDQHVNNIQHSTSASGRLIESPRRSTRKRARLSLETDVAHSPSAPDHVEPSPGRRSSAYHSRKVVSKSLTPLPECCQSNAAGADPCKCVFQRLVECLVGLAISVVHQSEGMFIHAIHQSSGYSFNLKWLNKSDQGEEALLYDVSSLGTFAKVAPEWMRESIMFNMSMCPMFFKKVAQVIKQC